MEFGYFTLSDNHYEGNTRDANTFVKDLTAEALYADQLGMHSAWIGEHHFNSLGVNSSPEMVLAYIAALTKHIRLAPAVTVLPLHNPIRVAEQWATLDLLSGGRVDFAAGRGYDRREYLPFGISFEDNQSIFDEGREVLRNLWNSGGERIDPFRLQDPWRTFVWEARRSQRRFHDATHRARKGPLQERLNAIGGRIDTAVAECWRIAQAGHALSDARAAIDVADLTGDLAAVSAEQPTPPEPGSRLARTIAALEAQLATARRLDETITDTRERLQLLDARLGEAVTRAIELSARAQGTEDLTSLDSDVDDLVGEMESLRQALDETTPASLGAMGGATSRIPDLGAGIDGVDPADLDALGDTAPVRDPRAEEDPGPGQAMPGTG